MERCLLQRRKLKLKGFIQHLKQITTFFCFIAVFWRTNLHVEIWIDVLLLHELLHLLTPFHQLPDFFRQDSHFQARIWNFRNLLWLVLLVRRKVFTFLRYSEDVVYLEYREKTLTSIFLRELWACLCTVVKQMLNSWMMEGYKLLKSSSRTNLS